MVDAILDASRRGRRKCDKLELLKRKSKVTRCYYLRNRLDVRVFPDWKEATSSFQAKRYVCSDRSRVYPGCDLDVVLRLN